MHDNDCRSAIVPLATNANRVAAEVPSEFAGAPEIMQRMLLHF